jgi:DNA-binding winged helix-turn-helix (wHTH) protein/TolB-like protein/tetratricopeptide (TPR) repeat protein
MSTSPAIYKFGNFRLDLREERLLNDGKVIPLSPKVFRTLSVLVENNGHMLTKNELMTAVWPETFVEESSLTQNISLLRKALDEKDDQRFIETVPKRGYRFVAPVLVFDETNGNGSKTATLTYNTTIDHFAPSGHETHNGHSTNSDAGWLSPPTAKTRNLKRFDLIAAVVIAIVGIVMAGYLWQTKIRGPRSADANRSPRSMAVLPFKTISDDENDKFLGLGMADALILRLSDSEQFRIRPTSSIFRYAANDVDPLVAGKELGVDAILSGTVQRLGDRVRVTVALLNLADGRTLWSEKYDERFTDIFALQDSVSSRVAGVLQLKLNDQPVDVNRRLPKSIEAYRDYTMGLYFWNKRTKEGLQKAIDYFGQATEKDPDYAPPYAGMADSYILGAFYGYDLLPIRESYERARKMATRAVELDPNLAEAHTAIGAVQSFGGDMDLAEKSYLRAIALNPNSATTHLRYGNLLYYQLKLDDAISEAKLAREIDPVSPTNAGALGYFLLIARQYDKSIEFCKLALEINPEFGIARLNLAASYVMKHMYQEASAEYAKVSQQAAFGAYGECGQAYVYVKTGELKKARRILAKLELAVKKGDALPNLPAGIAALHSLLGENDEAFAWLKIAVERHRLHVADLVYTEEFDPLRNDSRYQQLVQQITDRKYSHPFGD